MTVQELHAEAQKLKSEEIAELMDLLLVDAVTKPDPAIEEAWGKEIDRRIAELESGEVKGIPAEEVFAEMRKRVGL